MGVKSFRGRRVVARPPAAQMRLPTTVLARPRKPRSRWEPGVPLYPVPARDPELEAEMAWWGYRLTEDEQPADEAVWEAPTS